MLPIKDKSFDSWIIGYGNPQRRDDGIGPYVIDRLNTILGYKKEIHILSLHQLEPDLIEELRYANLLIFVDAATGQVEGGWRWVKVQSELRDLHYVTHHFKPSFLLGLLQSIYHHCPRTWLVSVQGDDFEFGEGLTSGAEKRARMVVSEIVRFILTRINRKE
ncbi:MAG: hydrogenase maturation protease [Desulfobacteraceae bacterium]|nr:hydrogenase maturation protease [Desulfobacteraceae bacterium]